MKIIGHKKNIENLRKLIIDKRIGHAYLFSGKDGIGKKLVAVQFAKDLMCTNSTLGSACRNCEACNTYENNGDFYIIKPEKNIIKVEDIRNLISEIYLKPTKASRKCFIIDEADKMNESAQNALLKVLEEPPLYASIILVASNKEKLLGTIKSRVTEIKFDSLSEEQIKEILGNEFNEEIIKYSRGSIKRALALADEGYISIAETIEKAFLSKNFLKINREVEKIKENKNLKSNIKNILETVMLVSYKNLRNDIKEYTRIIDILNETNKNIDKNANVDLALDNMILKICY